MQNDSKPFEVKTGLRQGDALSPTLFNLALEKIVRGIHEQRQMNISGESVMLAYADDIVVIGETKEEVVQTTERLLKASMFMGLNVNVNVPIGKQLEIRSSGQLKVFGNKHQ